MRPLQIGQCHATIHATSFLHFDTPSTLAEHNMITCDDEIRGRKRKVSRDAINEMLKYKSITIVMLDYISPFFLSGKEEYFFLQFTR